MSRIFIAIPSIGITDTRFALSLASISKPKGTAIAASPRSMPDAARNYLFDQAVKFNYDYVFFLDDDMVVDAKILIELQERMDADPSISAIAPLAFRRHPPFHPCVLMKSGEKYEPILSLEGAPLEVDAIHFAATLVRTEALKKIPAPRFEFSHNGDALKGEDIVLSEKLKAAGGKLVCHLGISEALHIGIPQLVGRKACELARQAESRLIVP